MTDFQKIKSFFAERADKFVHYEVFGKDEISSRRELPDFVVKKILNNPSVKDFFGINFPSSSPSGKVCIDSLDSFVFDFYFLDLGEQIIITDANRSFDCGVDAFEGNGVLLAHRGVVDGYLKANGAVWGEYAIFKQTNVDGFILDTINFVKILQTLNNAKPFPPYILELDSAKELVNALTRAWILDEGVNCCKKLNFDENSHSEKGKLKLAVFDNHKNLIQGFSCHKNDYLEDFNTHAFIGVFFNSLGEILICKNLKMTDNYYDFAISDFVLDGETCSLESLQRSVSERFGFPFLFGEIVPALTTVKNKVITDFFVVNRYDISLDGISSQNADFAFEWANKERLISLITAGKFATYSPAFIEYIYELKE